VAARQRRRLCPRVDQDGRIVGLALPSGDTIALTYDAASRITGMAESALPTKSFGYDALNHITIYVSGPIGQTYAYDASGNRTNYTQTGPALTRTYNYDSNSNRLLNIGGTYSQTFSYDANGNTLSDTSPVAVYTFTYDARNRRTKAYVGALATNDVINGLGQRTAQIAGATEYFAYDEAGHLIGSYNGDDVRETVWLGDLPVAVTSRQEPFYIAPDYLGAPHQITDRAGRVVWQWNHDPFGNARPTGPSGGPANFEYNVRFPGQFHDRVSELNYNYFRDYDPKTGRYIESDPAGCGAASTHTPIPSQTR
jgi:RHS repeat-associated protein